MRAKRVLSLALALALVFSCAAGAEEIPTETPRDPNVTYCVEQGVLYPGVNEPFDPDAPLSKIQFIVMVSRALGLYDDGGTPLYLSKQGHFAAAAATALCNPLSYPEESWAAPITRYEAASICYQALAMFRGCVYNGGLTYVKCAGDFPGIPADYYPIINTMYTLGVMNGVDEFRTFQGWNGVTGAQGCAIVRRLLEPEARSVPALPTDFNALFGSCTTQYGGGISGYVSPYRENRVSNILLAGSNLHELVVQPGETFSYNAVIGNAGKAQGYLLASVLKEGEYEYGYGGGICQVSSTLFNAALWGNMTILERYSHGRKAAYLPAGTDSTVYYGSLDLKWRNDYGCPVKLVFSHDPEAQTVTMSLYGSQEVYRPTVSVDVVQSKRDANYYTLTRTADGVANYTCNSRYNVKKK